MISLPQRFGAAIPGIVILLTATTTPAAAQVIDLTPADPPVGAISMAPNVFEDERGILLSWLEVTMVADATEPEDQYRLRFTRFEDGRWSAPRTIVEDVPFFANWADVPSIAATPDGTLYAHWLQKSGDATYAYDVRLARSDDGGANWHHLGPAHNDGTQTEHGFVSLLTEERGVRAFWLDGRNMIDDGGEEDLHGHGTSNMTLRTALVADRVTRGMMLDDRVCECCGTSAVMTDTGPVIFYRDRGPGERRDIWMVRYDGMEWTAPAPVHRDGWVIPGCPVNGPAAAARGATIVVTWYTAADNLQQVRAAFSTDAGATFGPPVVLDDSRPIGRGDVVLDDQDRAIACWLDTGTMFGSISARRVAPDGRLGPEITVTKSSTARSSGFPRLARLGDSLMLIWTEDSPTLRIRASIFPASAIPDISDDPEAASD